MSRSTRRTVVVGLLVAAVACGGWAWWLAGLSLNQADKWSSVLAGFAALVFGIAGVMFGVVTLRRPTDPPASPGPPAATGPVRSVEVKGNSSGVINTGDHNTFGGPAS